MTAKTKSLSALVQSFFAVSLPQRGMSPLTILSYRDGIKLLLAFASKATGRPVVRLRTNDVNAQVVRLFLDHLETDRGVKVASRNNRLAAIRSFFGFVACEEPALANHCHLICAIPFKRAPIRTLCYLERDEMQALLSAPDLSTSAGRRDHALVLFLYNTGARVQELTSVRAVDLSLVRPRQVLLRGKGRKERLCPLWRETARTMLELIEETGIPLDSPKAIFWSARGEPLTRFGVHYILSKHAATAARAVPSLKRKRLSPHVVRHTAAVHMLNSGVDINVIRSWLGHVDLRTTNIYAEVDLETKRKAVETCAPSRKSGSPPSWKRKPDLLSWLEDL